MNLKNRNKKISRNKGAAFLFAVLILSLTTVAISIGFTQPNIREFKNAARDNVSNGAFLFAEAGNEDAFYRLKNGMNVPAEIVMSLNDSEATTTVTVVGDTTEIVTNSAVSNHTRKSQLRVSDTTVTVAGLDYAAHVGSWGIDINNNAEVRGVLPAVGDIYSNGPVRGNANGVIVTGNIFSASGILEDSSAIQTSCVEDVSVGNTDPFTDYAQSFTASSTVDAIQRVELFIRKNGNPNSTTVYLVADNAGAPDTTIITSGTLDRNKVTSAYAWVSVTFDSTAVLTGGNRYWIVFDANQHNSRYWYWCKDATAPYADGSAAYTEDWSSPSWLAETGDLTFKVFYGEGESVISNIDDIQGDAHGNEIINSNIAGDAYYQTISGSLVSGTSYPGSLMPPPLSFPLSDAMIDSWVAAAEAGGTISGDCPGTVGCSDIMGPVRIDGNLTEINNETLTVTGTIYVTGNFLTDNNVVVDCDPSYGTRSCIIIVDGYMDFRNNTSFQGSGAAGSFIFLITRKADCIGTSGTGCGPGNSAMYHSNNASTGGIFFSQDSIAVLDNNASVSSVVARGVYLDNNSALIYDNDLQAVGVGSGSGGGGGGGGWLVEDWREVQ